MSVEPCTRCGSSVTITDDAAARRQAFASLLRRRNEVTIQPYEGALCDGCRAAWRLERQAESARELADYQHTYTMLSTGKLPIGAAPGWFKRDYPAAFAAIKAGLDSRRVGRGSEADL